MCRILPPLRLALVLLVLVARAGADELAPPRVPVPNHAEITSALAEIARTSEGAATVVRLGSSRAGRAIEALRIARGAEAPGRPAILVVAALEPETAWASGLVLDHARTLLARSANDEATRTFLETTTLWLLPRANPDAAEHRTSTPRARIAATGTGVDDDRDGRNGEDGLADIDGDGVIGWMRILDPEGRWVEDPAEPRVLIEADASKGQRGRWKLVPESRDADGDGAAGEDAPLDAVVNRNFPQGWVEHAPESGRYPTDEPEARALCDFVVRHPEIALVLSYGLLDNLAEKPKSKDDSPRRSANPSDGIPAADAGALVEIGRRWKSLGGTSGKAETRDAGTFQAWVQAQRGLWTVNLMPWSVPLDAKSPAQDTAEAEPPAKETTAAKEGGDPAKKRDDAPKPSDDAKRLWWFESRGEASAYRPWTRVEHPDFAHVEVGGFDPFALYEPPPDVRAEIADRAATFLVELAGLLARVEVASAVATDLGAGTWRVDAVIENGRYLPFPSALARRTRTVRPARVALEIDGGAAILAGARQELVSELAGSGGRREIAWIVRADSIEDVRVVVDTDSAGAARVRPEVNR